LEEHLEFAVDALQVVLVLQGEHAPFAGLAPEGFGELGELFAVGRDEFELPPEGRGFLRPDPVQAVVARDLEEPFPEQGPQAVGEGKVRQALAVEQSAAGGPPQRDGGGQGQD